MVQVQNMREAPLTMEEYEARYVYCDGGRSKSSRPRQRLDCVVRAFSTCLSTDYDSSYEIFERLGRKCGRKTPKAVWQKYADETAKRKIAFPAVRQTRRMNIKTFVERYGAGVWLVQVAGHVLVVIDGLVYDECEPRWGRCVYAAWEY